jgi:hypothetical protein
MQLLRLLPLLQNIAHHVLAVSSHASGQSGQCQVSLMQGV